jgi:hypothetical protein
LYVAATGNAYILLSSVNYTTTITRASLPLNALPLPRYP